MSETETMGLIEAAAFLRIDTDTLAHLARRRVVPGCKIGRRWVFLRDLLPKDCEKLSREKRTPRIGLAEISNTVSPHLALLPLPDPELYVAANLVGDFYRQNRVIRLRVRRIRQRTPQWGDRVHLRVMYKMAARVRQCTGLNFHLDHIIPLQGKRVSGLHIGANLRMLPALLNQKKHASFEP